MSFLMGKTKETSNVSGETSGLHNDLIKYIESQGLGGLNPSTSPDESGVGAFLKLFQQQNDKTFAQAKESAGNLTGSGLGNYIGNAAERASTDQNAFLSNFMEQRRQNDANRMLQLIMGTLGSPAGGVSQTYQPGFLDYAAQGASGLAAGGAFNSLFSGGSGGSGQTRGNMTQSGGR